jgi:hypothetical protein
MQDARAAAPVLTCHCSSVRVIGNLRLNEFGCKLEGLISESHKSPLAKVSYVTHIPDLSTLWGARSPALRPAALRFCRNLRRNPLGDPAASRLSTNVNVKAAGRREGAAVIASDA